MAEQDLETAALLKLAAYIRAEGERQSPGWGAVILEGGARELEEWLNIPDSERQGTGCLLALWRNAALTATEQARANEGDAGSEEARRACWRLVFLLAGCFDLDPFAQTRAAIPQEPEPVQAAIPTGEELEVAFFAEAEATIGAASRATSRRLGEILK